jgi:hypothetical protein
MKGPSRSPERELKKKVAISFHMDSCWQNTPKEIVNYILKLACGRLIYRDNRYIEIGKVVHKETECINKYLRKKELLKSEFQFVGNINRSWFLEFQFDGSILYEKDIIKMHGISFDYLQDNNFEICYSCYSTSISNPSINPWTRIRTIMN